MKCLRCGNKMIVGTVGTYIELLRAPRDTNISFDGNTAVSPNSVLVCKMCGAIEFNNKTKEEVEAYDKDDQDY